MTRGRKRTGHTPQRHFRAPGTLWEEIERIAAGQGSSPSWVARDALLRQVVRHWAAQRPGVLPPARNYWADTEDGRHIADPSEAETADLVAALAQPGNAFVVFIPADSSAWYIRASLAGDDGYEVEYLAPSLSGCRRSVHATPRAAAAAVYARLARRPGHGEPA